ncbi:colicin V synthesis protein [Rodentibacter caecimuris]|uniref:Colicin V synthesis protein n=1 Tax=Rodentibacter caecimuris TaxID=1796644 RepID=A0A9X8W1G2_9PAST|nr:MULTISPECIES: CvpA family protein [Pasteurellaceae]AOF54065.1 Colicin V production protein [Pasteurellaceae bacterium NI1060]MCQ9123089.1 CvpA family protein [Rodentibacter heylii]MCR1836655.1 CvpA family protein [Pasteurella caecimuris]MCU0106129.1 CvpA family protein [Pasteurella caecimuris]MCX2961386.1 CvpA family protein [Rodentibacter heylii]
MIDYIIIGIIAFSILVSLLRGFVREVLSLASWVVAFIVASQFYPYLATYLTQIESMYVRNGTAIGILFVLTLIVGGIINFVIAQLVDKTGLSGTDRVLGAVFGLLRGALIVAAILFFLDTFTNFEQTDWWKEAKLIPHFGFIIEWFFQQLQASSSFLNSTLNQ